MDLVASGRTLRRRWILTSFLFLLTLAAALAAWVKLPGPYQAESMVVLYPSQQASKLNGDNPLMSFGGSLNVAGDIVLRQVSSPSYAAQLAAHGYTSSFTIVDDPLTTGPILDITVTGKNQSQVEQTLTGVTAAVRNQLAAIQANYQPANRITSQVVSTQPTPKLLVSKKARTVVIVLGLGLVLTFAIPQVVDAEIAKRRGKRGQRVNGSSASAGEYAGSRAEQVTESETADREPQPAYQGSPAAPADAQAPRYSASGRSAEASARTAEASARTAEASARTAEYAQQRADYYQAERSDRSATERRYNGPPPGGRPNGSADPSADYPQRPRPEGTRI
jgi:hypothetical protein